jgi:hypothetical protein
VLPGGRSGPQPLLHEAEVPDVQVVTLSVRPVGHTASAPPSSAEPLELPLLDPLLDPLELPLLDPLELPLLEPLELPLLDPLLDPLELPLLEPLPLPELLVDPPPEGPLPLLVPQPAAMAHAAISAPTQTDATL